MNKLWLIIFYEYRSNVLTKGFLFGILSMPLLVALIVILGMVFGGLETDKKPLGYIDREGFLADPVPAPPRAGDSSPDFVSLIAFDSEESARKALEEGDIQAYYVLESDYLETQHVELFYIKEPGGNATRQFLDFVLINWLDGLQPEIAERAVAGSSMIARTPDGKIEFSEKTILSALFPGIMTFVFYIMIMVTAQTMVEAVVKEKENRTMEILITSVSPQRLITGKVLAVTGVCFTLLLGWVILATLGINIGANVFEIEILRNFQVEPQMALKLAWVFVPAYFIVVAIVVTQGATLVEVQEAQQVASFVALLFFAPYFLIMVFIEHPNSVLALTMSFIPITAPFTIALRSIAAFVPWWQILLSSAILWISAIFSIWLARKVFYLGLLRFGKRLEWKEIFNKMKLRSKTRAQ